MGILQCLYFAVERVTPCDFEVIVLYTETELLALFLGAFMFCATYISLGYSLNSAILVTQIVVFGAHAVLIAMGCRSHYLWKHIIIGAEFTGLIRDMTLFYAAYYYLLSYNLLLYFTSAGGIRLTDQYAWISESIVAYGTFAGHIFSGL
ncbi:hypothetical protein ACJX0J_031762 [Zea mays]